jgi:hypothetical protein
MPEFMTAAIQFEEGRKFVPKPKARKIMIIRHAEKPDSTNSGVTETGQRSKHDLIVRGWERAGALVCFFAPNKGPVQNPHIAQPQFLFASKPGKDPKFQPGNGVESKSNRPQETLLPLSKRLKLKINTQYAKGKEEKVAAAAQKCDGVVLIAWQHECIDAIVKSLPGKHALLPKKWPGNRFDIVYVLDLQSRGEYKFLQVAQCLLAGDQGTPIKNLRKRTGR